MSNKNNIETPAISIGLPVYNGEEYIHQAIDSALSQTFDDFELIISDNASTDSTQEICEDYCRRDPRIKYIRQPTNLGAIKNFELVARMASGTYFTWLAHDDRLSPDYLEVMIDYLLRHTQVVVVTSDFSITDANDQVIDQIIIDDIREDIDWNKRILCFFKHPLNKVLFVIYGVMKTDICKKTLSKLPSREMPLCGEAPFLCGLAMEGEVVSLPKVLRNYRRHSASYSATDGARIAATKSWFRRNIARLSNWNYSVSNRLGILLASPLPLQIKVSITIRVIYGYMKYIFQQFIDAVGRSRSHKKNISSNLN